ncbi:plant synaptotagmin [Anaeramoeba flamelloides]|uniref:Plant synaptotagmin n=1 Tax=Anaeramoeba flamelloides TaxID=1746091 RepID=A0ABQ8Y8P6_9EUKA|nr:plant synaptotagmin [Anaeramoeba flamelloides]
MSDYGKLSIKIVSLNEFKVSLKYFVEVTLEGVVKRSKKKNSSSPVWNEEKIFVVTDPNGKCKIEVKANEVIGTHWIELNDLPSGEATDLFIPIIKDGITKGSLYIQIFYSTHQVMGHKTANITKKTLEAMSTSENVPKEYRLIGLKQLRQARPSRKEMIEETILEELSILDDVREGYTNQDEIEKLKETLTKHLNTIRGEN